MNPMSFVQMFGGAANPQQMLNFLVNNSSVMGNPMARKVVEMAQQGNTQGLNEMMNNMCKEKHTTPQQMQQTLMQMFGR